MTDSMNVISALQAWGYEECYQDMVCQNNTDIIQSLLDAINERTAELVVIKVKSHSGVALNEEADVAAGDAANSDSPDVDTVFEVQALASDFTFSWPSPKTDEPPLTTSDRRAALRHWTAGSAALVYTAVCLVPTM
eukprot:2617374-Rhodomonas_salina.1